MGNVPSIVSCAKDGSKEHIEIKITANTNCCKSQQVVQLSNEELKEVIEHIRQLKIKHPTVITHI